MYKLLLKPLLFCFSPEKAHHLVFNTLKTLTSLGFKPFFKLFYSRKNKTVTVAGIDFPGRVGLAAGFDKNALLLNAWDAFGFGFIELGTVTPLGQEGNPKPRLFRLVEDEAIINRMGFNNDGADVVAKRLSKRKTKIIVGGNIGKNKLTPNEDALNDYEICFNKLYPYVDYFVVNVSSPNTPGLRELQEKEPLLRILSAVQTLNKHTQNPKPIFLKIAPDLTNSQLDDIVDIVTEANIAGVIATNTTIDKSALKTSEKEIENIGAGGLSGKPLKSRSTEVIRYIHTKSKGSFPIIGVGVIYSAAYAVEKIEAGASLVQVYSGFIYEGPALVKKISKTLDKRA